MVGDLDDFVSRLRATLPKRWFGDDTPNLRAMLQAIATPWVWIYALIGYTKTQARIATAVGNWLDLIAVDFFGDVLSRRTGESDNVFRFRISGALLRSAATRDAISTALNDIVGAAPTIFEPANPADTGCYASLLAFPTQATGTAYGQSGGWGNLNLPNQFLISVPRPRTPGIAMCSGYGKSSGAYNGGITSFADLALLPGYIGEGDIQATLLTLLPVNTIAWMRLI